MRRVWSVLLLCLLLVSVVAAERMRVGGYKVVYDQVLTGDSDYDGVDDRTSYYLEGVLVFSAYDTDGDGEQDMWFSYVNGTVLDVAMRDTTGDGRPENVVMYDEEGDILDEEERSNLPWAWIILGSAVIAGILIYFGTRKGKERKPKKDPAVKKRRKLVKRS